MDPAETKDGPKTHGGISMNVYIVFDDSSYPPKIQSVFATKKDADEFAASIEDGIVEEWEVIA